VRRDHLDLVLAQIFIELIAVICAIAGLSGFASIM
jgi:hypothetical protein